MYRENPSDASPAHVTDEDRLASEESWKSDERPGRTFRTMDEQSQPDPPPPPPPDVP